MTDCLYCGADTQDPELRFCQACEASGRAVRLRKIEDRDYAVVRATSEAWQEAMRAVHAASQQCAIMLGKWEA